MPQLVERDERPRGLYLGIDPGASGGLAVIAADGVTTAPMPATDRDLWDWVRWFEPGMKPFAVLEKVSGYIGEAQPGSAAFKFGASYGKLLMALTAAGIPFEEATPQRWQKALGIAPRQKAAKGKAGETRTQWKNRLKAFAQKLFPGVSLSLKTADALLIAEYCRRLREGKL